MEAQYQNEVRLAIQNLYNAYVDVLAARETVRYLETSVKGLDEVLQVYEGLYRKTERHQCRRRPGSVGSRDRDGRAARRRGSRPPEEARPGGAS